MRMACKSRMTGTKIASLIINALKSMLKSLFSKKVHLSLKIVFINNKTGRFLTYAHTKIYLIV